MEFRGKATVVGSLLGQVVGAYQSGAQILSPLPAETVPDPYISELPNIPSSTQHLVGGETWLEPDGEAFHSLSNFETKAASRVEGKHGV